MGYFHGFKLDPVVNDKGEILNFIITQGHVDDREPLKNQSFIKALKGKLFADKGYISKAITQFLFLDGLHLITAIRNNMKNVLMELKNICQLQHSRHRTFNNYITNLIGGLIAYTFFNKKPAIKYHPHLPQQLAAF